MEALSKGGLFFALLCLLSTAYSGPIFNPCTSPEPIQRGKSFIIGLAWWPGGTLDDWGNGTIHPCNAAYKDKLKAAGVQWGVYNTKVDQLVVLKTSYLETRYMMNQTVEGKTPVMSVIAFRGQYRSEPRYVMSLDTNTTKGVGFVVSLALMAKFDKGSLRYLSWYDLKCNECGGKSSNACIARTSCAMPPANCTCAATTSNDTTSNSNSSATTCDLNDKQFRGCSTSINLAFEGVDKNYQAFQTAAQVRKLNDYSLISMYGVGKTTFFDTKDLITNKFSTGYGNFLSDLSSSQSTFTDQYETVGSAATSVTG